MRRHNWQPPRVELYRSIDVSSWLGDPLHNRKQEGRCASRQRCNRMLDIHIGRKEGRNLLGHSIGGHLVPQVSASMVCKWHNKQPLLDSLAATAFSLLSILWGPNSLSAVIECTDTNSPHPHTPTDRGASTGRVLCRAHDSSHARSRHARSHLHSRRIPCGYRRRKRRSSVRVFHGRESRRCGIAVWCDRRCRRRRRGPCRRAHRRLWC